MYFVSVWFGEHRSSRFWIVTVIAVLGGQFECGESVMLESDEAPMWWGLEFYCNEVHALPLRGGTGSEAGRKRQI